MGHVLAHPELGCGDVGCHSYHDESDGSSESFEQSVHVPDFREACLTLERSVSEMLGTVLYGWGEIDGVPHPAWGDHCAETLASEAVDELVRLWSVEERFASGCVTYVWQWCWAGDRTARWNDLEPFTFRSEEGARAASSLVEQRVDRQMHRLRLVRRVVVDEQLV